ncbi:hypothetical protein SELMODRAFT_125956, partial [Selaginella moellendorffii]
IPLPAQGHVIPLVYLARKLALLGVTVTIINVDSIHETLQQSWKSEANPVNNGHDIRLESIEDPLAELLSRIDREAESSRNFTISVLHMMQKKAGLTGASFWPGNAAWAAIEFHVPKLLEMGDVPVKGKASMNLEVCSKKTWKFSRM